MLTGVILARRRGLPAAQLLDVVAPGIPIAQATGRLGNWFNQELFGRPTTLPWGLCIDVEHRPDRHARLATFHPTFLYEALWNLALAGALVLYECHRPDSRPGTLFALYVGGYGLGRLWVEALRIGDATRVAGVRVDCWSGEEPDDLQVAPFVVLAAEGAPLAERDHGWHMSVAERLVAAGDGFIRPTRNLTVDLDDSQSEAAAVTWWEGLVGNGGEGMVVKPLESIVTG